LLHALAYNLGVFLQGTDLPEEMADWPLTSLQTRLIKIGARVARHDRAITFQPGAVSYGLIWCFGGLKAGGASG
jgi:DDE family transposase